MSVITLLPLSSSKPIFAVKQDPTLFGKAGLSRREREIQQAAARLGVAPEIHSILQQDGMEIVLMKRIQGFSLADFYGTQKIPDFVWEQVHRILQILWNNGIEYVDITPYNFMMEPETGKVWIVDFGHARRVRMNWFLQKVLRGEREWTPDY